MKYSHAPIDYDSFPVPFPNVPTPKLGKGGGTGEGDVSIINPITGNPGGMRT